MCNFFEVRFKNIHILIPQRKNNFMRGIKTQKMIKEPIIGIYIIPSLICAMMIAKSIILCAFTNF